MARGASGVLLLRITATGLSFLTALLLARVLGASEYGAYAYALGWASILTVPAILGLNELLVRDVAAHAAEGRWGRVHQMRVWSLRTVCVSSVVLTTLAVGSTILVTNDLAVATALSIGFLSVPLVALSSIQQATLRGLQKIVLSQVPDLLVRPAVLLLCIVFIFAAVPLELTAPLALIAVVLAAVAALAVGSAFVTRSVQSRPDEEKPIYSNRDKTRSLLPFLLISATFVINERADIVMLGILADTNSVGVYAISAKVALLLSFVLAAINTSVAPKIAELFVRKEFEGMTHLLKIGTLLATAVTVLGLGFLALFGSRLLSLFGHEYMEGYLIVLILALGHVVNAVAGPVGQLLNMTGYQYDSAKAIAASAMINLGLNVLLIPLLGMFGAAIATATSTFVWNALLTAFALNRLGFATPMGFTIRSRQR